MESWRPLPGSPCHSLILILSNEKRKRKKTTRASLPPPLVHVGLHRDPSECPYRCRHTATSATVPMLTTTAHANQRPCLAPGSSGAPTAEATGGDHGQHEPAPPCKLLQPPPSKIWWLCPHVILHNRSGHHLIVPPIARHHGRQGWQRPLNSIQPT